MRSPYASVGQATRTGLPAGRTTRCLTMTCGLSGLRMLPTVSCCSLQQRVNGPLPTPLEVTALAKKLPACNVSLVAPGHAACAT